MISMSVLGDELLSLFAPRFCVVCRCPVDRLGAALTSQPRILCQRCLDDLIILGDPPAVASISKMTSSSSEIEDLLESFGALGHYEGTLKRAILALKRGAPPGLVRLLADRISAEVSRMDMVPPYVTWVPSSPSRLRQMGFDHGARLARAVAKCHGASLLRVLRRGNRSMAQHSLSLSERMAGTKVDLQVKAMKGQLRGARLLLVDDVCTTGATLLRAAKVLRSAGVASVHAVVLACTPRNRPGL